MNGIELVAIDLETTGLDAAEDAILEIAAVRFRDGVILEEWQTLVNPRRPIPLAVSNLTGIQDSDVQTAPPIEQAIPQLQMFVGNAPIVAHNIAFDYGFLQRQHILQNNVRLDTLEIASVLFPTLGRYALGSLATHFDIALENAHRALDDARATALLYGKLWERAVSLPYGLINELCTVTGSQPWEALPLLRAAADVLRVAPRQATAQPPEKTAVPQPMVSTPAFLPPMNTHAVADFFGQDGALANALPNYEARGAQVQMATAIAEAFDQERHIFIEADTGTGKTLAYLVPAALWAAQTQRPVVIATSTLNLQDQLIQQDIPTLSKALGVHIRAAVMKGRAHYLCPVRFQAVRQNPPSTLDELRVLAKLLVWMHEDRSGERSNLSIRGPVEQAIWERLSAAADHCTSARCQEATNGTCPFFRARQAAESAEIVITNHALLIADALNENASLPQYEMLIIDEAHNLEDALTNALEQELDDQGLQRWISELAEPKYGLLVNVLHTIRRDGVNAPIARLEEYIRSTQQAAAATREQVTQLFVALRELATEASGSKGDFGAMVRIHGQTRKLTSFARANETWTRTREFIAALTDALEQIIKAVTRWLPESSGQDVLRTALLTSRATLQETMSLIDSLFSTNDDNIIRWLSLNAQGSRMYVHTAPLSIAWLMRKHLWEAKRCIVLTSATLQFNGSFDYIQTRLGGEAANTFVLPHVFDYKATTLLYVPSDLPEPAAKQGYQENAERAILELASVLNGHMLILFTSYAQLRQTIENIGGRLALGGIEVFDSTEGGSRQAIIENFKLSKKGILMGTRGLWEGVDLPNDILQAVVIAKLPFSVPTDPIFAARADTYSDQFNEFSLPEAALRFRQGFGRLVRKQSTFLDSLPDCTLIMRPINEIGHAASQWLSGSNQK
jgi:ATP-dependent DNA helicase DinG